MAWAERVVSVSAMSLGHPCQGTGTWLGEVTPHGHTQVPEGHGGGVGHKEEEVLWQE